MYIAWNMHEPHPGQYAWEGFADVERFLQIAHELGLLVVLRPGPYICAEWDFGGFPWWLASSKARARMRGAWGWCSHAVAQRPSVPARAGVQVAGGGTMRLRQNDPAYLAHVDRWWAMLFSKLAPFLYQRGGPIVMVQVNGTASVRARL